MMRRIKEGLTVKYCDEDCNHCQLIINKNSKMITRIMNEAYAKFGDDFHTIVQNNCPNMTVCFDCRVDDFCHETGCEIIDGIDFDASY